LREEIYPKNILMVGPTGVGKTEIARRLARLANAPFLKVEASKFTEVGYVGRDVESIIRDLVEVALRDVRIRRARAVAVDATAAAEGRILDVLVGKDANAATRERFRERLRTGEFDDREISIALGEEHSEETELELPAGVANPTDMFAAIKRMMGNTTEQKIKVGEARRRTEDEETRRLIDSSSAEREAIDEVERSGIVFLDEIDKVADDSNHRGGTVSREGVQRDLLPLIEGTAVATKRGTVRTDHVLFIASGAFHLSKPRDLLPELQGRLPIRVELSPLSSSDFERILTEPDYALTRQYCALMCTEGLEMEFTSDGIAEIARIAENLNQQVENIGARRLHTVLERLVQDVSFCAPDMSKQSLCIDEAYVRDMLTDLRREDSLSDFIL